MNLKARVRQLEIFKLTREKKFLFASPGSPEEVIKTTKEERPKYETYIHVRWLS